MDESNSIAIVRRYAERWRIPRLDSFRLERERRFLLTVAHKLYLDNREWSGFAYVERNASEPAVFDFRPKQQNLMMPPLWAAYPTYSAVTIGWRMNGGEDYRYAWWDWYRKLAESQRDEYQHVFPVPVDDRGWNLWFYDVDDVDDLTESEPV